MEALEKAKLALRQFLLENKEKVRADLEYMRSKSVGNDIYNYVVNYSNSLSVSEINVVNETLIDVDMFLYFLSFLSFLNSPFSYSQL